MSFQNNKGYKGYSMSLRAVEAYENGLVTASKIKGIPTSLIEEFCYPEEWHHTSSHFNKTNFYSEHNCRVIFGLEEPTPED